MEDNKRKTLSAMVEHMQRYPDSGMTQKAYCETYGIKKSTFAYWLKKHRGLQKKSAGNFVQIRPAQFGETTEIRYVNGVVVRFSGHLDVKYLRALIG